MSQVEQRIYRGMWADVRLKELGLVSQEKLRLAVAAGEMARRNSSPLHPRIAPGFFLWADAVKELRVQCIPEGWRPLEEGNLSRIVHPISGVAVAVATGNEITGRDMGPEFVPSMKHPRGAYTSDIIEANTQGSLFGADPAFAQTPPERSLQTYWLLISPGLQETSCELMLPSRVSDSGMVLGCRERILLNPVDIDAQPISDDAGGPSPFFAQA